MMKRASMVGRGADIFFGEPADSRATPPPQPVEPTPSQEESLQASKQAIQQASVEESKQASTAESVVASKQAVTEAPSTASASVESNVAPAAAVEAKTARKRGPTESKQTAEEAGQRELVEKRVRGNMLLRATVANTFRYTDEELEAMSDIIYEMAKQQKVRVNKNDIVRLGLNWIIEDYKASKQASLLARLLASNKT